MICIKKIVKDFYESGDLGYKALKSIILYYMRDQNLTRVSNAPGSSQGYANAPTPGQ